MKIGIILVIEFIVLFALGEFVTRLLMEPGLNFMAPQMLVQEHPTRIYYHAPNQRSYTIDKPFVTNSAGFRDDREFAAKTNGEFRILSLGDSIAVGLGVRAEDTYTAQLERLLNRLNIKVINASVGGYSTWMEVDLLKEKGIVLQPDIVLLGFFWNDLYVRPLSPPAPKGKVMTEMSDQAINYLRLLKKSTFLLFLRDRINGLRAKIAPDFDWVHQQMIYEGRSSPYVEQAYSETAMDFMELKALGDSHRFTTIILIIPMPDQVRRHDAPRHMQQRIKDISGKIGLRTVDLLDPMRHAYELEPDLYIPWDNTHLTQRGHQVVAETLAEYLRAEKLIAP